MSSSVEAFPKKYWRIKTPTLIQIEATECGAVSLGIILAYYGRYVSIEELRIACGISRDGSNAAYILEAAAEYGLEGEGYSVDLKELYEIENPAILYWKFNHFLVLEGFGKNGVYINDPATGPRTISYEEFSGDFTGIALIFEPTAQFKKEGSPPSLLSGAWRRLRHVKSALLFTTLVGLGLVIPNLAFPALAQIFVDQVIVKGALEWKWSLIIGLFLIIILKGGLSLLQGQAITRLKTRLSIALNTETLWHMLRLPMQFYMQRFPGEVAYRLTLNESINHTLADKVLTIALSLLFAISYGVAIAYYSPLLALAVTAVIMVNLLIIRKFSRSRVDHYAQYEADMSRSQSYSIGGLQNIESIKASGSYQHFFGVWAAYYTKVLNSLQVLGKKDIMLSLATSSLQSLTFFLFIALAGWKVLEGEMTLGAFLAVQLLLISYMQPIYDLAGVSQNLQLLNVDMSRLDDLIKYPLDPLFQQKMKMNSPNDKLSGQVEVKGLDFGYSLRGPPLLVNIHMKIHPGQSIALVGHSGSGKSTLAKVIAGLLYPVKGEVLFDGQKSEEIERQQKVDSIAFIEQDPFVFSGTIKENITLFDETIPSEDIIRAAELACLHDVIVQRPGKYELHVQENGMNLSGGEKQRLEIARALVKNPSIIIMDEATSSLDNYTEREVIENIRRKGVSVLMIAHRLSSIRFCDEIIVLEKGKIRSKGTHEELAKGCPLYKELVEIETAGIQTDG